MSVIGSAHILCGKEKLKQQLHSSLQKWFLNPEAFRLERQSEKNTDEAIQEPIIEMGFTGKPIEMYKYRSILRELKQDIDSKDGLSWGYVRTEGNTL